MISAFIYVSLPWFVAMRDFVAAAFLGGRIFLRRDRLENRPDAERGHLDQHRAPASQERRPPQKTRRPLQNQKRPPAVQLAASRRKP
jgi:hypothetical protein